MNASRTSMKIEMKQTVFVVDAFTTEAFQGNPAGVCLLESDSAIPDDMKQKIAAELSSSETAFVYKLHPADTFQKDSMFGLQWFTPINEIDICGHATLASAVILLRCCGNESEKLAFRTRWHGDLFAIAQKDGSVTLDLPLWNSSAASPEYLQLVHLTLNGLPYADVKYCAEGKRLLIRLEDNVSRSTFEQLQPPVHKMQEISDGSEIRGVILTLKGTAENGCINDDHQVYDFVSRYFAPWEGIAEDPVTGSAHAFLTPYWSEILNKTDMFARQCSRRGGELKVRVREDNRVEVQGNAVIVCEGTMTFKC